MFLTLLLSVRNWHFWSIRIAEFELRLGVLGLSGSRHWPSLLSISAAKESNLEECFWRDKTISTIKKWTTRICCCLFKYDLTVICVCAAVFLSCLLVKANLSSVLSKLAGKEWFPRNHQTGRIRKALLLGLTIELFVINFYTYTVCRLINLHTNISYQIIFQAFVVCTQSFSARSFVQAFIVNTETSLLTFVPFCFVDICAQSPQVLHLLFVYVVNVLMSCTRICMVIESFWRSKV